MQIDSITTCLSFTFITGVIKADQLIDLINLIDKLFKLLSFISLYNVYNSPNLINCLNLKLDAVASPNNICSFCTNL